MSGFDDDLRRLDPDVWLPAYLPEWSSRAEAAATWRVADDGLHLGLPPAHGLWCADRHDPPLRVSAVQSGAGSGPVGSTRGQAPFRPGLTVREQQPPFAGFTPLGGLVEVECRATIPPGAMFSAWLIGQEDEPQRSGELCLVEVFGDALRHGCGVHAFRDPALVEDFATLDLGLDVAETHRYAVDWRPGEAVFLVDGVEVRRCASAPDYPMQLELGVFDFPAHPAAAHRSDDAPHPELVVSRVRWVPAD